MGTNKLSNLVTDIVRDTQKGGSPSSEITTRFGRAPGRGRTSSEDSTSVEDLQKTRSGEGVKEQELDSKIVSSPYNSIREFEKALREIIPPRSQSDRTCFSKVCFWIESRVLSGKFDSGIYERVLDYAREAANPTARNPAAVFMSLMKNELNYLK